MLKNDVLVLKCNKKGFEMKNILYFIAGASNVLNFSALFGNSGGGVKRAWENVGVAIKMAENDLKNQHML